MSGETETVQPLPAGLDTMPPGPALEAALAGLDITRLANEDVGVALRARYRQKCYTDAMTLRLIYEAGQCDIVLNPDQVIGRKAEPDEFSADEARWLLAWTTTKAGHEWGLAADLIARLPRVLEAMLAGACDQPRAKVFSDWLVDLTSQQEQAILDELLPQAGDLTTSQLRNRIRAMAIAVDADWAERRYRATVRGRDVSGRLNPDGSGTITGSRLPADRAAAGCQRVARIARRLRQLGATRTRAQLRADLFLGLLDGVFDGLTEDQIIGLMLTEADLPTTNAKADGDDPGGNNGDGDDGGDDGDDGGDGPSPTDGDGGAHRGGLDRADGGRAPAGDGRALEGVEIRVEVATLLGLNQHPGQLPDYGPVPASVARRLVGRQLRAQWRWAVVDADGRLLTEGITRRRPEGWRREPGTARPGIVELQIPAALLDVLTCNGSDADPVAGWRSVLDDIVAQHAAQRAHEPVPAPAVNADDVAEVDDLLGWVPDTVPDELALPKDPDGPLTGARDPRRFPTAAIRRYTEIRDRTCYVPTCRVPASDSDQDHLVDHRHGGRTTRSGLAVGCRHDHRARHAGALWHHAGDLGPDIWITGRTGHLMPATPPPVIEPLPDPVPRHRDPWPAGDPTFDDPAPDSDDVWEQPNTHGRHDNVPGKRSPPRSAPHDEPPPF